MRCPNPNCGRILPDDSPSCNYCGTAIPEQFSKHSSAARWPGSLIVLLLLGLGIVAGGSAVWLANRGQQVPVQVPTEVPTIEAQVPEDTSPPEITSTPPPVIDNIP